MSRGGGGGGGQRRSAIGGFYRERTRRDREKGLSNYVVMNEFIGGGAASVDFLLPNKSPDNN